MPPSTQSLMLNGLTALGFFAVDLVWPRVVAALVAGFALGRRLGIP